MANITYKQNITHFNIKLCLYNYQYGFKLLSNQLEVTWQHSIGAYQTQPFTK